MDIYVGFDGILYTEVLGGIVIYGKSKEDLDIAHLEAFEIFCIAAEKHGLGIKRELEWFRELEKEKN